MNAAARDTRLPLQARAIAFWIIENPSETIDPEVIARANELAVSYVRKLLAKLAELGYLIAPQKMRDKKGHFEYTPYMLPPQDKITSTVEEPARSEAPHGQNNQHGQTASVDEKERGLEYALTTHTRGDVREEDINNISSSSSLDVKDKNKDKKTLPAFAGGEAKPPAALPDTQPVKPRPAPKPKAPRERNALFDAVVRHIFRIDPLDERKVKNIAGRVGLLIKNFPADPAALTPERLEQFAKWWDAAHPTLNPPQGTATLTTAWSDFEKVFKNRLRYQAQNPPVPELTDEELNRIRPTVYSGVIKVGAPHVNR